jgi:hypothetical protein
VDIGLPPFVLDRTLTLLGNNRREFPAFFPGKTNGSVGQGKQRIVAAAAYVGAGVYAGSPLAYDD